VKKGSELGSPVEALRYLAEQLNTAATRPNINGYRPHAKQMKFHSSEAKKKLYIGGNRSGKTTGGIVEDIWWLTGKHPYRETPPPPVRGRINCVDFVNGVESIAKPELARWLPPSELINGSWEESYDKYTRTLTLANGSFVEFKSYDQDLDKFAGTSRHFIHYDEEPPEVIYTENQARLIDTGGSWWMTMTPVEGMTWVYDEVYEPGMRGEHGIEVIVVDMTENPYLNQGEVQNFLSSLSKDEKEARVHGKFVQVGGLIYKQFDPTPGGLHVIEQLEGIPRDVTLVASLDHGYNNPTAWLYHAVFPSGSIVTFYEHYASGMVIEEHARHVRDFNAKVLKRAPDYYVGDPSIRNTDPITGTSVHQEYAKYGISIVLGNNDVSAGINRVAAYMRPDKNGRAQWHVTRNCTNLIKELTRYRWKTYSSKKLNSQYNNFEVPHKKDDHAVDSLRYFIMSRPDLAVDAADSLKVSQGIGNVLDAPIAIEGDASWHKIAHSIDSPTFEEYDRDYFGGNEGGTDELGAYW